MVFQEITLALDMFLGPLTILPTYVVVLLVSVLITSIMLGLNRVFVNKNLMKEIRTKMEDLRENLTQAQKEGNKENTQKFLNELMRTNNQYMKHTFKTLIVSLVIISIFLPWLGYRYEGMTAATLPFEVPIIGSSLSWLYWYVLVSIALGWISRKLMGGIL